jgi:hypothetical protein
VHEAPIQDIEESVAVTRLNLEHAKALQTDQVTLREEDAQIVVRSARQVRVIKKHEKKGSGVIFCEFVARSKKSREAALLGYCGLGTAIKTCIKMSAILFDDKNLELFKGLALAMPFSSVFYPSPR